MTFTTTAPALSVLGVTKAHANRAIKWASKRSLGMFYRPGDKSLNAFPFRFGNDWTYEAMQDALDATR